RGPFRLKQCRDEEWMRLQFNRSDISFRIFGAHGQWTAKQGCSKRWIQTVSAIILFDSFIDSIGTAQMRAFQKPNHTAAFSERAFKWSNNQLWCIRGTFRMLGV